MLIRLAVGLIAGLAYVVMSQMLQTVIPGGSLSGSNRATQFKLEEPVFSSHDSGADDDTFGLSR